jgi:hypothetical protein
MHLAVLSSAYPLRFVTRLLFTLAAVVTFAVLRAAEPKPPAGFRALFNGQDLTGWHGLNPHDTAKLTGEKRDAKLAQMRTEFAHARSADNNVYAARIP